MEWLKLTLVLKLYGLRVPFPTFKVEIAEALSSFTGLQRCPCAGSWEMVFQTFTGLQAGAPLHQTLEC
jgi:hypothetical protein